MQAHVLFPLVPGPGMWQLLSAAAGAVCCWQRQFSAVNGMQSTSALHGPPTVAGGGGGGASALMPVTWFLIGFGGPFFAMMAQLCLPDGP